MPSPSEPNAPTLATTQRAFAAALRGGPESAEALLALLDGDSARNSRRFRAYRRNVFGNWIAALRSTCPAVAAAVGDAAFAGLARDYAMSHDSPSGDLDEYGADFAEHLAATPGVLPWLADLARLEWALQEAYYAADGEAFDFAALAGVPAERHGELCFRLAPAFRRQRSDWPLARLWQDLLQGQAVVAERGRPQDFWVVRRYGRVGVEAAGVGDAAFVAALIDADPLATAITRAQAVAAGFDVGSTLARLAELGLLAGFSLQGEKA